MNSGTLLTLYISNILILWLFLGLSTVVLFSRKRLARKGYSEPYIEFLRKDNRNRCLGIALVVPLIELLAAGVVYSLEGSLSTYTQFLHICLGTVVGILPFPIIDSWKSKKAHKAMVQTNRETIVVDLSYRVWHLVFEPGWEAVGAAAIIGYSFWMGQLFNLGMLHLGILWLLYLAARNSRFMTGPGLSDLYHYNFYFMVFNHLLILFHLVRMVTHCCPLPGESGHSAGIVLASAWAVKLLIYLLRFPQFRRKIELLVHPKAMGDA